MGKQTSTWKATERRVAQALGGRRMGPGGDRADVRAPGRCIEVKHRATLPQWLERGMAQAKLYAYSEDEPLLIIHRKGQRMRKCLVVMELGDYEDFHGALPVNIFTEAERSEPGPIPF